jgi:hypothetical protein
LATEPLTCSAANVEPARRPSQSPSDESPSTAHSRRNGRIRRIALSAARLPDGSTWPALAAEPPLEDAERPVDPGCGSSGCGVDGCPRGSSVPAAPSGR